MHPGEILFKLNFILAQYDKIAICFHVYMTALCISFHSCRRQVSKYVFLSTPGFVTPLC